MDFMHYDLSRLQAGNIVEVALRGNVTNVRLLDDEDFNNYRDGDPYHFVGGLVETSPVYLQVPQMGHWHLIIDMQGLTGSVESAVRLMQRQSPSMRNLMTQMMYNDGRNPTGVASRSASLKNKYDVFIAHVSEDKGEVARPLAGCLKQRGVQAGFDEFEIKNGGLIYEPLDKGFANCRYGIIIISKSMILRRWRRDEWSSVAGRILTSRKPVFPIWHDVTEHEISTYSAELAKKPARLTKRGGTMDRVASEIASIIMA